VTVGQGELRLRTITGEEYQLREENYVPARLREHIVDAREEIARHHELFGREEELASLLARLERERSIRIVGPAGIGKTAMLCGLMRAVEAGTEVLTHFFGIRDSRTELIRVAEKSLAAQIALRFGLPESVLD